jgi:hypothetical protein
VVGEQRGQQRVVVRGRAVPVRCLRCLVGEGDPQRVEAVVGQPVVAPAGVVGPAGRPPVRSRRRRRAASSQPGPANGRGRRSRSRPRRRGGRGSRRRSPGRRRTPRRRCRRRTTRHPRATSQHQLRLSRSPRCPPSGTADRTAPGTRHAHLPEAGSRDRPGSRAAASPTASPGAARAPPGTDRARPSRDACCHLHWSPPGTVGQGWTHPATSASAGRARRPGVPVGSATSAGFEQAEVGRCVRSCRRARTVATRMPVRASAARRSHAPMLLRRLSVEQRLILVHP